jgi:hypothetical protein
MKRRTKTIGVIVCLALIGSMTLTSVGVFAESGTWTTRAPISSARFHAHAAVLKPAP